MKAELVVQKFQKVRKYIPVAALAIFTAFAASSAYALSWPPTAADLTTAFGDIGENIGTIFMACVAAGLALYGGVLAVMSGFRFFGKFVRQSQAA